MYLSLIWIPRNMTEAKSINMQAARERGMLRTAGCGVSRMDKEFRD